MMQPNRKTGYAQREPNQDGTAGNERCAQARQANTDKSAHSCFLLSDERGGGFDDRPSIPVRTKTLNESHGTHNSPFVPHRRAA